MQVGVYADNDVSSRYRQSPQELLRERGPGVSSGGLPPDRGASFMKKQSLTKLFQLNLPCTES